MERGCRQDGTSMIEVEHHELKDDWLVLVGEINVGSELVAVFLYLEYEYEYVIDEIMTRK